MIQWFQSVYRQSKTQTKQKQGGASNVWAVEHKATQTSRHALELSAEIKDTRETDAVAFFAACCLLLGVSQKSPLHRICLRVLGAVQGRLW
jgi:hypothetical protein